MFCPITSFQRDYTGKRECSEECAWYKDGCLVAKALIAVAGAEIPKPPKAAEPKFRPPVNTFPWGDQ